MANTTATSHVKNPPQSATKTPKVLKRRGRKGNKIDTAFKEIPAAAVNFDDYAQNHGIKTNVLRQIKRHDKYKTTGKVFIRKNKETQIVMIWREQPQNT